MYKETKNFAPVLDHVTEECLQKNTIKVLDFTNWELTISPHKYVFNISAHK